MLVVRREGRELVLGAAAARGLLVLSREEAADGARRADGAPGLECMEEQVTGSPRDQRHYEPPSAEALEAEFEGWHVWLEDGRWYAQLLSPPVVRQATDLVELRNWLIGWTWAHRGGDDGAERQQ